MSLPFLDLDEEKDANLLQFLNTQERGQESLIIHPGSHTIKFGLASQQQPFLVPNIIAYPTKLRQKVQDYALTQEQEERFQQLFDSQIERVLPEVEHDLRKKDCLLTDSKIAKNIRNKQVQFKVYDENNCINEYVQRDTEPFLELETDLLNTDPYHGMQDKEHYFLDLKENDERDVIIGRRVYCIHQTEEYLIRRPIRYGNFNINQTYPLQQCCSDLQAILEDSLWEYMRLPKKNYDQLNVILIIPDMFQKLHIRYLVNMLLGKMRFKGIFVHTESVLATYSMAIPSACVVDIGSSKINVCCVEEGIISPKSLKRKHFGGDDITQILYRFINRNKALHYFTKFSLMPTYHVHAMFLDQIKEAFSTCQMTKNEIVKTCNIFLKEKMDREKKTRKIKHLLFNCSEALVLAPQALFYSSLLSVLKKCKVEVEGRQFVEVYSLFEEFSDPEDIIQDILHTMNNQQNQPSGGQTNQPKMPQPAQPFKIPGEESPAGGNTPSLSVHQDNQSELGEDQSNDKSKQSLQTRMQEPMDIDDMICKSICSIENSETRRKLAQQIILVGGTTKLNKFVDCLEDALINRFSLPQYDETIDRVEVVLINAQQQLQVQAQQLADPTLINNLEQFKTDPRFMSWLGASIIPRLDSSKDLFIPREKFIVEYRPYKEHFEEMKKQHIQVALDNLRSEQEEKKQDQVMKDESRENGNGSMEDQLTQQQIETIEKEVTKRIKRKEQWMEALNRSKKRLHSTFE